MMKVQCAISAVTFRISLPINDAYIVLYKTSHRTITLFAAVTPLYFHTHKCSGLKGLLPELELKFSAQFAN